MGVFVAQKKPKPRPRPAWDDHVTCDSNLFDSTLKQSVLLGARAGDRQRELNAEDQQIRDRPPGLTRPHATKLLRYSLRASRSGESLDSARSARRQSVSPPRGYTKMESITRQLPRKPPRDFVKQNIEQVTGQTIDMVRKQKTLRLQNSSRNVFERLAVPRTANLSWRTTTQSSQPIPRSNKQTHPSSSPPVTSPLHADVPVIPLVLSIDNLGDEVADTRTSPALHTGYEHKFGQVDDNNALASTKASGHRSVRHSPKQSATSRSPSASSRHQQPSYAARVFAVLDRLERKRIGVDQVLQGLRLLGLPATHNQVSLLVVSV